MACPCCNEVHDKNKFFYKVVDDMTIHVRNNSESYKTRILDYYKVVKYLLEQKVCRANDALDYVVEEEKHR